MKFIVSTPPNQEPLALADVKVYLRTITDDTSEDIAVLNPLITAAREYCEARTGRAFAAQTIKAYPAVFAPEMRMPRTPVVAVTGITYTDMDGVTLTLDADRYGVDTVGGEIVIYDAPQIARVVNPIEITYTAGYMTIPAPIRQAMLLLIGHWYTNREAVVVGAAASAEVTMAVESILNQGKAWWF